MFIGPLLLLVVAPALRRIFLAGDTTPAISSDETPDEAATDTGAI